MNRRASLATLALVVQAGAASAADLPPAVRARGPVRPDLPPVSEARLVPTCEEGDDALVLSCGRVIVLPSLDDPLGERVVEAGPVSRRPYRQVFSWGE